MFLQEIFYYYLCRAKFMQHDMGVKISGVVVGGNKIGRRLGFPTANIVVSETMPVKNGVYAAHIGIDGEQFDGIVNLGHKPSVSSDGRRVLEANIFDFDRTIYGQSIEVELLDYIREERTFASFDSLKSQIDADKQTVKMIFQK